MTARLADWSTPRVYARSPRTTGPCPGYMPPRLVRLVPALGICPLASCDWSPRATHHSPARRQWAPQRTELCVGRLVPAQPKGTDHEASSANLRPAQQI
eukprot:1134257-Prorocentrum_minimum.AAC.1